VRQSSTTAPRTVCSEFVLTSDQVPNGSLVEVTSMFQVATTYTPMVMIGGYLQAVPSGAAPLPLQMISRPHGTNFNSTIHHQPMFHFGSFWVTEQNRANWFSPDGFCAVQQVGYSASTVAPATGWVLKLEYVQLDVKVTKPAAPTACLCETPPPTPVGCGPA
jgi:hypothetical protein